MCSRLYRQVGSLPWSLFPTPHAHGAVLVCDNVYISLYPLCTCSRQDFKEHVETVTFIAPNATESHKWWAVNLGTFEKDFTRIVPPELTENIVRRLRQGERVEFPNRCGLADVKDNSAYVFMG